MKLKGKKVLLRLDLDVPVDNNGKVKDDARLRECVPTINSLKGAKQIIMIGHLGRTEKPDKKHSLHDVASKRGKIAKIKININTKPK